MYARQKLSGAQFWRICKTRPERDRQRQVHAHMVRVRW